MEKTLIRWAEIEKAIEELIVHEEGVRFQRLAISLAKKRWPEIIATEVHKDAGKDAISYHYLTKDGGEFVVACSITATYEKIKHDMDKNLASGNQLAFLAFYTPKVVSNTTIEKWQNDFRKDYESELIVITREEIIHELIKSENHWMCEAFLGLPVEVNHDIETIVSKYKGAAQKIIEQWKRHIRSDTNRLINIEASLTDDKGKPLGQNYDPRGIAQQLTECRRIVLKGSPGAGKTTTLVQIAELLLDNYNKVPLIISLSDWAESEDDIMTFISKHPILVATGISSLDIALLHEHGRLTFLFNGWNEIVPSLLGQVGRQLQRIDRDYSAGIIVASREHHVSPPLYESMNLVLQSLNNTQRKIYIKSVVPKESSEDMINRIETNKSLNSITRTPLFLSEIIQLYINNVQIPDSKYGILQSVIMRAEQNPEHSTPLQIEPLSGRATQYLSLLAFKMTENGRVGMQYEQALAVINEINEQLRTDGQIVTRPDPQMIIDILCSHHLLEKSVSSISTIAIHFVHQQFQEFYASTRLMNKIALLCRTVDEITIRAFQRNIINMPIWEESLKLLAEEISRLIIETGKIMPYDIDAVVAGRDLVRWTIPIDPFFAAKLVGILGKAVWDEVKDGFGPLLRKWYECKNEDYRECALAAIFATGSEEFSDIIWPLLEHTDQQVRLSSYRAGRTFNLTCLGSKWKERICRWDEDRRSEFISELSLVGQSDAIEIFEEFAKNDLSPKVRATAIDELDWCGRRDKMWQVLEESKDDTFKVVVQNEHIALKNIPEDMLSRFTNTYQQQLSETDDPSKRLEILLKISDLSEQECVDLLKSDVEKYPIQQRSDFRISHLRDAVGKIAICDPDWASEWVVRKQAEGRLCDEHWSVFITKVPGEIIEQVIQKLLSPDCPYRRVDDMKYLINKGATKTHAHVIIQAFIEIHCHIKEHYVKDKAEMYHRLKDAIHAISWQTLVEAFQDDYVEPESGASMEVILNVAGCGTLERNKTQPEINKATLDNFKISLHGYLTRVLAANDYSGGLKADMSCALAVFGESNDVNIILQLIYADIDRIRKGHEAHQRGDRQSPLAQGASTRWDNWHIRALCRISPENADKYLLDLLKEPEYEEYAGYGLLELLKRNIPKEKISLGYKPLKIGAVIQEKEYIDATKSRLYSLVIEKCIRNHIEERKKAGKAGWVGRSIITLASIGEPYVVPLILEVLQVPQEYGAWTKIDTLEILIKNGYRLDTGVVELILDQVILQIKKGNYNDQNEFLFTRCLSILACTNDQSKAIAKIKQLVSNRQLGYEMREVVETLGYNGLSETANYLIELAQTPDVCAYLGRELIQALANLDLPESKKAILSIIDPAIQKPKLMFSNKNYEMEIAAEAIANWCRKDPQVKKRIIELCEEKLSKEQRNVLAGVINSLNTTEAVIAGLNLITDQSDKPIPFHLREAIEKSVTEHVPSGNNPNAYDIRPHENIDIRRKLYDMIYDDDTRNKSAFKLLGFIGRLRLENGNPPMEPRHPNIERNNPWPPVVN
jgi:hypothetical protein